MVKKFLAICLIGFAAFYQTRAQLAITEVMTGEADKNHPDWWELTDYGTNNIDLTGYSWNDDSHGGFSAADTTPFSGVIIHPGESIVVTEQKGAVTDAATFQTWWGIDGSVQVIILNSADPGLSNDGDSVRLWSTNIAALGSDTNGLDLEQAPEFLVQRVDTGATASQSLLYDPANGKYDLLSTNGVDGAFSSTAGDIGSPGIAPNPVPATITQLPADLAIAIGGSASFTNAGLGLPPLIFHWYFKNNPINSQTPGASIFYTNGMSVLTLTGVQMTNNGTYTAVADNGIQSFTNDAVLTVNAAATAPAIQSMTPAVDSFDVYLGQAVTFTVAASGFPPPAYQWRTNAVVVPNATNNQFTFTFTDTNQSGVFSVMTTNSAGGTNVSFTVNVTPIPDLVITEVESSESADNSNGDVSTHQDWFELSNFGNFPVNLFGFRIDDSHNALSQAATVTNRTLIQPGESVVFVQNMTPDEFRAWWGANLSPAVQIIDYNGSGQGLSSDGDEIHVWNAAATDNPDEIASAAFDVATAGISFGFDPAPLNAGGFLGFAPDGLSVAGGNGAFTAAVGGDIGSPGTVVNLPRIISVAQTNGSFQLSWLNQPDWNYEVLYKDNLSDTNWSVLTNFTSGAEILTGISDLATNAQRFYRVSLNLAN